MYKEAMKIKFSPMQTEERTNQIRKGNNQKINQKLLHFKPGKDKC